MAETYSQGIFSILFIIYLLGRAEALLLNPARFSDIGLPVTENDAASPKSGQPNPQSDAFSSLITTTLTGGSNHAKPGQSKRKQLIHFSWTEVEKW